MVKGQCVSTPGHDVCMFTYGTGALLIFSLKESFDVNLLKRLKTTGHNGQLSVLWKKQQ